jgi:hypothetical protein
LASGIIRPLWSAALQRRLYDRIHAATRPGTEPKRRFVDLLSLVCLPYAAKIEKNSLFYFFQPCYPINSKRAVSPFISLKIPKILKK